MKKVLIIGGGLAGCFLATQLQDSCDVVIVTKGSQQDSNSMLAQGGIAASLDPGDSPKAHEDDTMKAGDFHNSEPAVKQLVTTGPELLKQLIGEGMKFDRNADGTLNFGLEGAHSHHRILHANGDQTGAAITSFVQSQLHNVTWVTNTDALELLVTNNQCKGVLVRHLDSGKVEALGADAIVLATGGLGNLFDFTTNDHTVTGDGMALAARAGAKMIDMAFVQFHPTLLSIKHRCYGLITEAIRGAGAVLVDENGTKIMAGVPRADLAPRDVVARHLTAWQAKGHELFLDISRVQDFEQHFPGVTANLDKHHVPFRKTQRIPIQPGAHFMMGGVAADLNAQTSINRLWAVGEVACNRVHGANRLASNSLLDCLVSGQKAAAAIQNLSERAPEQLAVSVATPQPVHLPELSDLQHHAWTDLGVERTHKQLHAFLDWLHQYNYGELDPATISPDELTRANLCLCSQLIAEAALAEPKSLGAHYLKEA